METRAGFLLIPPPRISSHYLPSLAQKRKRTRSPRATQQKPGRKYMTRRLHRAVAYPPCWRRPGGSGRPPATGPPPPPTITTAAPAPPSRRPSRARAGPTASPEVATPARSSLRLSCRRRRPRQLGHRHRSSTTGSERFLSPVFSPLPLLSFFTGVFLSSGVFKRENLATDTPQTWLWPPATEKDRLCWRTLKFRGYLPRHTKMTVFFASVSYSNKGPTCHPLPPHPYLLARAAAAASAAPRLLRPAPRTSSPSCCRRASAAQLRARANGRAHRRPPPPGSAPEPLSRGLRRPSSPSCCRRASAAHMSPSRCRRDSASQLRATPPLGAGTAAAASCGRWERG